MKRSRWAGVGWLLSIAACGGATGPDQATPEPDHASLAPPAAPLIPPDIPDVSTLDRDNDKIDDRLGDALAELRASLGSSDGAIRAEAQARSIELMPIECTFRRPVTADVVRRFEAAGGTIRHLFRAVGYGWVGEMRRGNVEAIASELGADLLLVRGERELRPYLDEATRVGRVRPVWAPTFAGNPAGFSGSADITIAILDSGVDASHTDLAGRMAFWHDYTSAAATSPLDPDGHGTHVAGIATGTGAALGVGPATLSYTESADLTGQPEGTAFENPIHLPASSLTFTSVATWLAGSTDTLYLFGRPDGDSSFPLVDMATGSSPLTRSKTFTAASGDQFFTVLFQTATPITRYGIVNRIANYPPVGDGFNILRGVAPGCQWGGARVSIGGATKSSDLELALDDMVAQRVAKNIKVLNISLGLLPGEADPVMRAMVNSVVANGILAVSAAGNAGPAGNISDPARAARALTVGASNDANELTSYTSTGFASPQPDEDTKPDVLAPGGSHFRSMILAPDSNGSDAESPTFADLAPNDYANREGTSMAAPFVAGAGALVIDALQHAGLTWDFGSAQHPLLVKMLLSASATETNTAREFATGNDPTLGRASAPKDLLEGYGLINPDAAVEAASLVLAPGVIAGSSDGTRADRRAWGRKVESAGTWTVNLKVAASGDYDLYVYAGTPDVRGNPVVVTSSVHPGVGVAESIAFTTTLGETDYLFIKRVSGKGDFSLSATNRPCGNGVLESGEQCDDGNLADGDCCSSLCQFEANGSACSDGLLCTETDTCQLGACVGGNPVACAPADACHVAGVCNPANGGCSAPAAPNGTPCDDGNGCTLTDACQAGACVGGSPKICPAIDECHANRVCMAPAGTCPVVPVPDGTPCSVGACFAGVCVAPVVDAGPDVNTQDASNTLDASTEDAMIEAAAVEASTAEAAPLDATPMDASGSAVDAATLDVRSLLEAAIPDAPADTSRPDAGTADVALADALLPVAESGPSVDAANAPSDAATSDGHAPIGPDGAPSTDDFAVSDRGGGCGCRTTGGSARSRGTWAFAFASLWLVRRRKRNR